VVFVSDNPDFFMARYDLSDTNPIGFAPTESGVTVFIDTLLRLQAAGPITIAAIRGRARGGGSEVSLGCDIRFASLETALLGQPEVGVGTLPAGGAVERLPWLVGPARALEIIASSDDYDAATAERYGWVNRAIPDAEFDAFVDAFARRLALFDAQGLATAKRLVMRTGPTGVDTYRETLAALRERIASPATAARRIALANHGVKVGPDFELRMGHHLGVVGTAE
jgi:enoyl-CoA hydratase/carnithine racemase